MKLLKTPGLANHIRDFIIKYLPVHGQSLIYTSLKFDKTPTSISSIINNKKTLDTPTVFIGFEPHLTGSHMDIDRNGFSIEKARGSTAGVPLGMGYDTPDEVTQDTYISHNYIICTCDIQENCLHIPFLAFHPRLDTANINNRLHINTNRSHMVAYMNRVKCPRRERLFDSMVTRLGSDQCHSLGDRCGSYPETKQPQSNPRDAVDSWYNDELYKSYSKYNFVVAMENTKSPGYITEKIYNAFLSGAIPIYYGDKIASDIFNTDAFINVDEYPSYDACADHIANMSQSEIKHMQQQPIFKDNKLHPLIDPNSKHYTFICDRINTLTHEN